MIRSFCFRVALRSALTSAAALLLFGCGAGEPKDEGAPPLLRRLTATQYQNIIADVFGSDITVPGAFDPIDRAAGLVAVGASFSAIMPSAAEHYETQARAIAAQVVSEENRDDLIACHPQAADKPDDACAHKFLGRIAPLLLRRPQSENEIGAYEKIAHSAAERLNDFYGGLQAALSTMLVSPSFLYIRDVVEPDPATPGAVRLDAYSKAARLSFLLWNTTPDEELLKAAEQGTLNSKSGLLRETERMIASARIDRGVRAFFADMLALDATDTLEKDAMIYPAFSLAAANDSREETLRTISYELVNRGGDYRDLFETRDTFMSGALGILYRVPAAKPADGWVPFTFTARDHRHGIQSELSFLALHSHPGKSSPTLRGRAIRELLLCQNIPDPPANVNFTAFNDPNSKAVTARERLTAHSTDPSCAGCHKLMDPIGLTLETFDGAGQIRNSENGHAIDSSGELDGVKFDGAEGLAKTLHDSPALTSCVVTKLFEYATGRAIQPKEKGVVAYFDQKFASDRFKFIALLKDIATSDAMYAAAKPVQTSAMNTPAKAD